jgi:phage shock protein PspC (stress-responsive transcriptional regulator)
MNIQPDTSHPQGRTSLRRSTDRRMLGGVAAGVAASYSLNVTYVRGAFVALAIFGGAAVPLYLAAWALIPEEDSDIVLAETVLHRVVGQFS